MPGPAGSAGATPRVDLRAIRALCIDLDGTLLDTIPDLAAAANAMLVTLGHAPLAQATLRRFVGKGAEVLIARTLAAAGVAQPVPAAYAARAREAFYAHYRDLNGTAATLYDGVADGIARIAAAGRALAVVTNKPGEFVPPLLQRFGLGDAFAFWIAGDTVRAKKPAPDPFLEAARRFGTAPGQVLVVGDSINDAQGARAAAMPVVLVPYGYNEGEPVASVDCDGIVSSLAALAGFFESA